MEPDNQPLEKEISIGTPIIFSFQPLNGGGEKIKVLQVKDPLNNGEKTAFKFIALVILTWPSLDIQIPTDKVFGDVWGMLLVPKYLLTRCLDV